MAVTGGREQVGQEAVPQREVPAAAATWGQTIAGLLTIGGIVTLIQGGGTIEGLKKDVQQTLVWFLILALVLAVFAVILAFSAAVDPKLLGTSPISRLNASITSTIIAIILLALAAYTLWSGQEDTKGLYFVTYDADKTVVCGKLTTGADGKLFFNRTPLAGVGGIEAAEKGCPGLPTPVP